MGEISGLKDGFDYFGLLDHLHVPVLVIDRNFFVSYANAAAVRRGVSIERRERRFHCYELTHGATKPCFESGEVCPVHAVFRTGVSERAIHRHLTPQGTGNIVEVLASPIKNDAGEIQYVVEEFHDTAELFKSEAVMDAMRVELNLLRGLLAACAGCKRIRTSEGKWEEMESYVMRHSTAEFSHGLCPDCVRKHYPDFEVDRKEH